MATYIWCFLRWSAGKILKLLVAQKPLLRIARAAHRLFVFLFLLFSFVPYASFEHEFHHLSAFWCRCWQNYTGGDSRWAVETIHRRRLTEWNSHRAYTGRSLLGAVCRLASSIVKRIRDAQGKDMSTSPPPPPPPPPPPEYFGFCPPNLNFHGENVIFLKTNWHYLQPSIPI